MKASSLSTEACALGVAENSRNDNGLYARCLMSACRRVSGIRMCRVWYIFEGRLSSRSSLMMKQRCRFLFEMMDDVVRTSPLPLERVHLPMDNDYFSIDSILAENQVRP